MKAAVPNLTRKKKMMNHKEKRVITIERYRRTVVRCRSGGKVVWRSRCAVKTVMLAPNVAAAILQTTAYEIFRLTEAGEIHYLETEAGALLVCRNSLKTAQ